jgi:hypothetical protein
VKRRDLILGVPVLIGADALAEVLISGTNASAQILLAGNARASTPGAATSIAYANKSASASPATTPLAVTQAFKRGSVPSGFVAVPIANGTLLTYQADSRTFWDDGSLRVAVFRCLVSSIASGGTVQITFPISAGSYSNTSSNTVSDITAHSDYKLQFTKVHTASVRDLGEGKVIALKISGGAISGGTVFYPTHLTLGPTKVQGGGGTGGKISVFSGTLSVVSGGSGYANTATGTFSSSFNSIVSVVNANANHNGASLVQYAKGPICDAWRGRMPISGMPHFHVTFYVERWKDGSGNFLAFKSCAVYGSGMNDTVNALPNYTFDIDWKNGSTVIRGTSNSDPGYTNIVCYAFASAATFKRGSSSVNYVDAARMDWSANDAVLSAIVQQRTPTECDQLKATGLISPWLAIRPTIATPAFGTATAYVFGTGAQDTALAVYQPFASAGLRCTFGTGGADESEAPIAGEQALHWMWLRQGNTANANIWLVNSRVACAHGLGTSQTGAGWFDPTNLITPSVVPTSAQTFTGMFQSATMFSTDITVTGYLHPMMIGGGIIKNTYHQPCYTLYAYLHDGEQWMLDALYHSGALPPYSQSPDYGRQVTLGTITYYGLYADNSGGDIVAVNVREPAWWLRTCGYADALMPSTWADGSTAIEASYIDYLAAQTPTYLNALISFIGTFSTIAGGSVSKTRDYSGSGVYPEQFKAQVETIVPFMDDYEMMVYSHLGYLLRGTTTGNAFNNFLTYRKNYYTKLWAYAGSHYLNDAYRINILESPALNAAPSDTTYSREGNASSPALSFNVTTDPTGQSGANITMRFANGSPTVTLSGPMILQGTTIRVASGSRIKLTTINIATTDPAGVTPPTPFITVTWYYWKELTSTTGQLCTDAGLTLPVTATGAASGIWFWVVPANTLPADNSGNGTYGNGLITGGGPYLGQKYGTMRSLAAFEKALNGRVTTNTQNAMNNLQTLYVALNASGDAAFGNYVANAYDNTGVG